MFIRPSFVTLIVAAAALGTPVKRDVVQVGSDIENMKQQSQVLDEVINAFPSSGGTFAQLNDIHEAAMRLDDTLKAATKDADGSAAFTDLQTDTIVGLVARGVPVIQKGVDDLKAKKPAISALYADPFVKADLETLRTDADALGDAILAKAPADKKVDVQEQIGIIDNALSSAIDMYSS